MTLRVAIDATAMVAGDTGVARYAAMHLAKLATHTDVAVRPFAIGRGPTPGVQMRRVRLPLRVVQRTWRHLRWPSTESIVGPVDIVHSIDIVPPPTRAPLVITVHDVLPLTAPSFYASRQRTMILSQLRAAQEADLVVTTCEATAAEIESHLGIPRNRMLIARLGRREPLAEVPVAPVDEPFILAVGSLTPRKGFLVLLDAMELLGPSAPQLVFAGPVGHEGEQILARIHDLAEVGRVRVLGRVDDPTLEALYRSALLVCHPSLAEGFGIPVLEAMGFGTPVVAADIPPVREVGGDAVVLVPPGDAASLAAEIDAMLRDDTERARRAELGRELASALTWDAMTATIVEGYRTLAALPR